MEEDLYNLISFEKKMRIGYSLLSKKIEEHLYNQKPTTTVIRHTESVCFYICVKKAVWLIAMQGGPWGYHVPLSEGA